MHRVWLKSGGHIAIILVFYLPYMRQHMQAYMFSVIHPALGGALSKHFSMAVCKNIKVKVLSGVPEGI